MPKKCHCSSVRTEVVRIFTDYYKTWPVQLNLWIWYFNDCFNLLIKYSLAQYYYFTFIWVHDVLLMCLLWLFMYIMLPDKSSYQYSITYSFKVQWSKVLGQPEISTNRYGSFASAPKRRLTWQLWFRWQGRGHIIKGESIIRESPLSGDLLGTAGTWITGFVLKQTHLQQKAQASLQIRAGVSPAGQPSASGSGPTGSMIPQHGSTGQVQTAALWISCLCSACSWHRRYLRRLNACVKRTQIALVLMFRLHLESYMFPSLLLLHE